MNHDHENGKKPRDFGKYVLIGFGLIAGFFLLAEHQAHVFGALPYLLLLACPLLHLFHGHGGHGGHGGESAKDDKPAAGTSKHSPEPPRHHHP